MHCPLPRRLPCLAEGSGRHAASLRTALPRAPKQLGLALISMPRSLIFLLWLGHGRQIPLGYPYLIEVLETDVNFRGLEAKV